MPPISNDWLPAIKGEFQKPYYKKLHQTVMEEYQTRQIFPEADDLAHGLVDNLCPGLLVLY